MQETKMRKLDVMDYAKALAKHPRWTWEQGMGVRYEWGVGGLAVVAGNAHTYTPIPFGGEPVDPRRLVPLSPCVGPGGPYHDAPAERVHLDTDHPATKGWILWMLRKATGIPGVFAATPADGHWMVYGVTGPSMRRGVGASYASEFDALAAALLLAWGSR